MVPKREITIASMVLAIALPSCEKKPEPRPATTGEAPPSAVAAAPSAPSAAAQTPTVPAHMKEHFAKSAQMRDALIKGKLEDFKQAAAWMSEHELTKDFPPTWKHYVEKMQSSAKEARDAKDIASGATAFGTVGAACGACHAELGGPKIQMGEPPAEGSGSQPHMIRHQWAAERMWEGLMAPSEAAWVKGAEIFADAPLHGDVLTGPKSVPKDVQALGKRAHDLGHKGRTAKDTDRGAIYGDLLATCASCHDAAATAKP